VTVDMTRLITKFLGFPEAIGGWDHGRSTHLDRWTIFRNKRFQVFLDHSGVPDSNGNLQNYPERFISVGIARSETNGDEVFRDRAAWMLCFGTSSLSTKSQVSCE